MPISNELLLQQLSWRYATKKFNPAALIPAADWRTLEEALVLTPSAYGLQPWRFLVVTSAEVRRQLLPCSWNQSQVVEASHLVVFARKVNVRIEEVEAYLRRVTEVRGTPPERLASYRNLIVSDLIEGPRRLAIESWTSRQVYIALGNFLTCAALLGIDVCPMEGIVPEQYDQVLGLAPRGLATVVACAAGYRAADDHHAAAPKVRFPLSEVVERI